MESGCYTTHQEGEDLDSKIDLEVVEGEQKLQLHKDSKDHHYNQPLKLRQENIVSIDNPKLAKFGTTGMNR